MLCHCAAFPQGKDPPLVPLFFLSFFLNCHYCGPLEGCQRINRLEAELCLKRHGVAWVPSRDSCQHNASFNSAATQALCTLPKLCGTRLVDVLWDR